MTASPWVPCETCGRETLDIAMPDEKGVERVRCFECATGYVLTEKVLHDALELAREEHDRDAPWCAFPGESPA